MSERRAVGTFILGTAVELTCVISIATATTAKITILDSSLNIKTNLADMTKQADKVYNYIYQSASTDLDGLYTAIIKITSGGYDSVFEDTFELVKQTGT